MGIDLHIVESPPDKGDAFDLLVEVLRSLRDTPEFPFDVFYNLVLNSLEHPTVSIDSAALAAGHLSGVAGPSRHLELVIATLAALDTYLHRFRS
uniref:hypothetical protein n=1 Tax=Pseudomonas grimontii TaxID=129847 RepID=UPI001356420A|nr:hypothetical protein [Pseudomonas grimontii]